MSYYQRCHLLLAFGSLKYTNKVFTKNVKFAAMLYTGVFIMELFDIVAHYHIIVLMILVTSSLSSSKRKCKNYYVLKHRHFVFCIKLLQNWHIKKKSACFSKI